MADLTFEQAVEQYQEALQGLRTAERDLGWELARVRLEKMGVLLDDLPEPDTISDPRD